MIANHCGLYHCPLGMARNLMPELQEAWDTAPIYMHEKYIVDVKIHMLMPGQWPCIPNWHCDFVPRDDDLQLQPHLIDDTKEILMWLSGPPITEFADGRLIMPKKWVIFNQRDQHRGVASKKHTWRTFIRLVPEPLLLPAEPELWIRRHAQVYLDVNQFTW